MIIQSIQLDIRCEFFCARRATISLKKIITRGSLSDRSALEPTAHNKPVRTKPENGGTRLGRRLQDECTLAARFEFRLAGKSDLVSIAQISQRRLLVAFEESSVMLLELPVRNEKRASYRLCRDTFPPGATAVSLVLRNWLRPALKDAGASHTVALPHTHFKGAPGAPTILGNAVLLDRACLPRVGLRMLRYRTPYRGCPPEEYPT